MSDDTQTNSAQTSQGSQKTSDDGVIIDKNKSSEQYIEDVSDRYIVPVLIRQKYPDLVKLIYETESMDQDEREYWLQIMPIMSEEQIVKLRDILVNEKVQLEKLDAEYQAEMEKLNGKSTPNFSEEELKKRYEEIAAAEQEAEEAEKSEEEKLLSELENL